MGYHQAGFDVLGVDLVRRRNYPFPMVQADALGFLGSARLGSVAAIHASPPCQHYSSATAPHARDRHPDLVEPVRQALIATGKPWVIENVPLSPLRVDLKLCGCMFGLPKLRRQRWFETSWHAFELRSPCYHPEPSITVVSGGRQSHEKSWAPREHVKLHPLRQAAMGIDWMSRDDMALAIPPAYTEYIGKLLLAEIDGRPNG